MKIIASIEARMSSSRLPGKSMRKILEKPMLELMIERIKKCEKINEIVIATSENKENDIIEEMAKRLDVKCFRGSEDDVLDRVLNAAKSVNGDVIIELWGDSPLIDKDILNNLIIFYLENNFDCVGTNLPNFKKTYPVGLSALIFSTKILDEVDKITSDPDDRENVSNYIYEHPQKYKIASLPCSNELNFPDIRLTVDEENDFKLIEEIFNKLYSKNYDFSAKDVIKFLNSQPELVRMNKEVKQKRLKAWDNL